MGSQLVPILDQFAAKIDVDLKNGMTQFSGLIGEGVQDLVEFGQILGNIGHALLNFASDMPGLAEVLLKIIDAISGLILWLSKLPAPIITTIMVIEELFRWGGLLVGVFAQIGSAMAGMGFLGLPIIGKIVTQFGEMFQMLALGAVGFVGNLGKMITGIGEFPHGRQECRRGADRFRRGCDRRDHGRFHGADRARGGCRPGVRCAAPVDVQDEVRDPGMGGRPGELGQCGQGTAADRADLHVTGAGNECADLQRRPSSISRVPTLMTTTEDSLPLTTRQGRASPSFPAAQQQLSTDFGNEIGNVDLLSSKYKIGYVEAAELAGDAGRVADHQP